MPPKAASSGRTKHKSTLKLDSLPPPKKFKAAKGVTILSLSSCPPLSPTSQPSFALKPPNTISVAAKDAKGKGKATCDVSEESKDDLLWVDKYGPRSLQDLAVHKRKVDDVRRWLDEAFSEKGQSKKHRRLLILTGPAGSAKTATLRMLAREMGFVIVEYKDSTNTTRFPTFSDEPSTSGNPDAFATFLARAGAYTSVFTSARRKLVLVEDLPNILHPAVRSRFHDALRAHVECARDVAPLVVVVSDTGVRAEEASNSGRGRDLVIDARTVVPPGLSLFSEIRFNPIAPTLLTSAVKRVAALANVRPSLSTLHSIMEGAGGDVRSAIMTLEFACSRPTSRKQSNRNTIGSIVSMTQKENALLLFHLMGKIMYNKRKGDRPASSASARDVARDRELDRSLEDPPPLPHWLVAERRRTSRVDVNMLYASTPIDASLFGLYIHQNYTQYCSSLEQCSSLIENLSWTDINQSENWYDANPHTFHMQALGTLHALPSPVPRTGQSIYKPAFFGALRREQSARDALDRTSSWLSGVRSMCYSLLKKVEYSRRIDWTLAASGDRDGAGRYATRDGPPCTAWALCFLGTCVWAGLSHEQAASCGYLEDDDIEDW
ncbi:Rad17 cell cycle checkpoint protein-domain-containing protein [Russula compacta]|nr:Rad17 cell cycle checkpoint protein-domain-containing protein [Russula compacta]